MTMSIPSNEELSASRQRIESGNFYVRMSVEFGPQFGDVGALDRAELLRLLQRESRHHKGFVSSVLEHLAEHIESDPRFKERATEPAPKKISTGYDGCDSCNAGEGNHGQVCYWDDGTSSCELC